MNLKKIKKNKTGFSLVELIVVLVVASIIVGILARFLISGINSYFFLDKSKEVMRDARLSIHFMNRDFRQIKQTGGIMLAHPDRFKFVNYNDKQIEYKSFNNEIKRNGNLLADNISSFEFKYMKINGGYLITPVSNDSLDYIWNVEAEFEIANEVHQRRLLVLVHPRNY